jgi:MFS family permease
MFGIPRRGENSLAQADVRLSAPPVNTAKNPLRVLRHRDYRRMWIGFVVSDIGTWMQLITVSSLIASRTGSALKSGLVSAVTFAPQLISSPIAGVLADRLERRKMFLVILLCQTVGALGLALAIANGQSAAVLTCIVLAQGLIGSMANPVVSAILPELVPADELLSAASLGSISWNSGRIVGPIFSAALMAAVGPTWSVLGNALSFALLFWVVLSIKRTFQPAATDGADGFLIRMRTGLRVLAQTKTCLFAFVGSISSQLLVAPFIGLLPYFAASKLKTGNSGVGVLMSTMGVSSLLGSLALSWLVGQFGRPRVAVGSLALGCVGLLGLSRASTTFQAVLAISLLGSCFICGFLAVNSVVLRDAPPEARGRISSLFSACIGTSYGTGVVWMGAIADHSGIDVAFVIGGCVALVLLGLSVVLVNKQWRSLGQGDSASLRARKAGLVPALDHEP